MFHFFAGKSSAPASRLAGQFLFSGLKARELKILETFMHERRYLAGEIVFDEGEDGQALYLILSGSVLICHPGHSDQPIASLEAGNLFGEMALIDDSPRVAQARAGETAELAVLFRGDFERLMETHAHIASRIAIQLARLLGQRLRQMVSSQGGGQVWS